MRVIVTLSLFLLVSIQFGCSKKETASPNSDPTSASKADPVIQLPVQSSFTPHIDTFYGTAYENDFAVEPVTADSMAAIHVYVSYPATGSISITSDLYNGQGEMGVPINFRGNFAINDSNEYTCFLLPNDNIDYYKFKLRNDSIYCYGSAQICPDVYMTYFAGKRVNKAVVFTR